MSSEIFEGRKIHGQFCRYFHRACFCNRTGRNCRKNCKNRRQDHQNPLADHLEYLQNHSVARNSRARSHYLLLPDITPRNKRFRQIPSLSPILDTAILKTTDLSGEISRNHLH